MRRLVTLLLLLCTACTPKASQPVAKPQPRAVPSIVSSNVTRADYAGTQACAGCHADELATYLRSPMHNMTRKTPGALVRAPFAGERFRFKRDEVELTQVDGERFITLESKTIGTHVYRVTRVIGGRVREDFAAIEVKAAQPGAEVVKPDERIMPVSYVLAEQAYRYKGYSVMTPERPGMRPGAVWNRTCIFCHNTEPYLDTMLGALTATRSPYQGEVVDALLPLDRREPFVDDAHALFRDALDAEMKTLSAQPLVDQPADGLAAQAIRQIRRHFAGNNLVETGIGCESCHLGSSEHVAHYHTKPSFAPRGAITVAHVEDPEVARARDINHTCARCHQVLFTGYPFTWEGGKRSDAVPGGSHISSGEARDFLLGDCRTKLHCARCHDPHSADGEAERKKMDGLGGNETCTACHGKYAQPEALAAHSHHDPTKAGASCMDCHMAKKNMSLDMKLSRYHRIGSPNDPQRVERDRPIECALCHKDKKVGELVDTMEAWWGKKYDRTALRTLYGEATANVLAATLANGKPHEQAVAMYALGESGKKQYAPLLAAQLTHPYPILRFYARDALTKLLGAGTVDLNAEDDAITRDGNAWLARAHLRPVNATKTAATPSAEDED